MCIPPQIQTNFIPCISRASASPLSHVQLWHRIYGFLSTTRGFPCPVERRISRLSIHSPAQVLEDKPSGPSIWPKTIYQATISWAQYSVRIFIKVGKTIYYMGCECLTCLFVEITSFVSAVVFPLAAPSKRPDLLILLHLSHF